jgi:hypothetical protein
MNAEPGHRRAFCLQLRPALVLPDDQKDLAAHPLSAQEEYNVPGAHMKVTLGSPIEAEEWDLDWTEGGRCV